MLLELILLPWARKAFDIIPKKIPIGIAKIEPVSAIGQFILLKVKLAPMMAIMPKITGIAPSPEATDSGISSVVALSIKSTIASYRPGM